MKTILVDAVDTLVIEGQGVFKEMQDLLDSYPNRKIIVTNANDEQFKEFGLDKDMPYEIYTLKHNPDKTDPAYFTKLFINFGLSSHEVIYFEHNSDAVNAAQQMGVVSYHYDDQKKDLTALKQFLSENLDD